MPVKGSVPKARYRTSAVACPWRFKISPWAMRYKNRMLVVGGHDGAKHLCLEKEAKALPFFQRNIYIYTIILIMIYIRSIYIKYQ